MSEVIRSFEIIYLIIFTHNKQKLLAHFRKDPVLFAYHIGDLDDINFEHCQWAATYGRSPGIEDVILLFTGLEMPTVLAFGLSPEFESFLEEMLDLLPDRFHGHFQKESRATIRIRYSEESLGRHLKMKLTKLNRCHNEQDSHIVRLGEQDEARLREFYDHAYPENYFHPRMLVTGKYFGWIKDGQLLSAGGVHVYSDEYQIAALGNIATAESQRGRGLATKLTSRLTSELIDENKLVCLNVSSDNAPAIRSYEKLGFEIAHEFEESIFQMKS